MTTETANSYDARYEEGLKRYEAGEALEALLPHFVALRQEKADVRVSVALSWLYTLTGDKAKALHYCREAKQVPQGRYNHALALLTFGEKGVREKLDEALRMGGEEGRLDALENLKDAIAKKGGHYPAAQKLLGWLNA